MDRNYSVYGLFRADRDAADEAAGLGVEDDELLALGPAGKAHEDPVPLVKGAASRVRPPPKTAPATSAPTPSMMRAPNKMTSASKPR